MNAFKRELNHCRFALASNSVSKEDSRESKMRERKNEAKKTKFKQHFSSKLLMYRISSLFLAFVSSSLTHMYVRKREEVRDKG
jgi:hypothetical protein